jgi:hypothetical protein
MGFSGKAWARGFPNRQTNKKKFVSASAVGCQVGSQDR